MNWIETTKNIVFWSGTLEFAGATQSDAGGRSVRFRMSMTAPDKKLAHPFSRTVPGARLSVAMGTEAGTLPQFECQLINWVDSPTGRYLKIALNPIGGPESDDLWGVLLGATRPSKGQPGTSWGAAFVLLGEDEQPVCQKLDPVSDKPAGTDNKTVISDAPSHGQLLSNQAAIMLKGRAFQQFILSDARRLGYRDADGAIWDGALTTEAADKALKWRCGITSKRELDTNPRAADVFKAIRSSFTLML